MFFSQATVIRLTGAFILSAVKRQLANMVTLIRILLATIILLIRMGLSASLGLPAIGPFTFWGTVVCALTDKLDGFLARKLDIVSRFGIGLDRGADKYLFATIFSFVWFSMILLLLSNPRLLVIGIVVLLTPVTIIEILLALSGAIGARLNWPIESAKSGKWKMVFECITGSWWALFNDLEPYGLTLSSDIFLWPMFLLLFITNILAFMSAHRYAMLYWPLLNSYWRRKTYSNP